MSLDLEHLRAAEFEVARRLGFEPMVTVIDAKSMSPGDLFDSYGGHGALVPGTYGALSSEAAMQVGAVWACRRVVSEDVSAMPRRVKRVLNRGTPTEQHEVINGHPIAHLLTVRPNDWMRPGEFVEWLVGVAMVHEAAYAWIVRDERGRPVELLPLMPGAVQVRQTINWDVEYLVHGYGETAVLDPGEILKLRGPMDRTGIKGYAVGGIAARAIELAAAIEASQSRFHANDMRPSGAIQIKGGKVSPELRERIRNDWQTAYGPNGRGGVAVLDADFDFKTFMLEGAKSEVVDNRKFQIEDICRFMRVYPAMIGHSGGQVYGSFEQQQANHARHSLLRWVIRVEEAMTADLLTEEEVRSGLEVDLDMDEYLRGTANDRAQYYERASKLWLTPNEVRRREGLNPIDDEAMNRVQLAAHNTGLHQSTPATRALRADTTPQAQQPKD